MKSLRIDVVAGLAALALLMHPGLARTQNYRNCAWPIELSPEGYGNATLPESLARYFLMPFDKQYATMTIKGTYPNVRYFSYVAYNGESPHDIAGNLFDAKIAPDPGSINTFIASGRNGTYTVVISRNSATNGNTIGVSSDFVWLILRMYIPSAAPSESGQTLTGGVPLPTIVLGGQQLLPCSPVNKLPDVTVLLNSIFPSGFDLKVNEGTPSSDLWFAPPKTAPMALFPNPDNKYMAMLPGDTYQPGRIIVIHGKAPGFPDTYHGSPIWMPARGFGTVDMRYWSVCHSDFALPMMTVDCAADLTISREGGYYTVVISDDLQRPDWLSSDINWLPWGDEQYPKLVFFRNMLAASNFPFAIQNAVAAGCTVAFDLSNIPASNDLKSAGQCAEQKMGDYYPVALWCDKSTFIAGGWQACIKQQ